ncbi:M23 family metallopeptidase [Candidatus Saccharibacteria bacterium]|nr:M23 family metallopeptidase [Candidatus Saccharibacteria bacterium]
MSRRPVDSPYQITTEFGVPDSYAKFGRHSGVDYAVPLNRQIFAPVSGTLTNVVSPTGGNMGVIFDGRFYHRLMHNNSFSRGNGAVSEGNEVAKAGTTGLSTGVHSHWDINTQGTYPTSFAAFIPPADFLAGKYNQVTPPPVAGGNNMFNTEAEVIEAYLLLRGTPGTAAERAPWIGQSKQRFFVVAKPEADSTRKQLADVKVALANLQAKPPTTVIKEVIKIVDRPVEVIKIQEVIKEVPGPVDEKATVVGVLKRFWDSLFKKG